MRAFLTAFILSLLTLCPLKGWGALPRHYVASTIEDTTIDEEILKDFSSETFVNKVYAYRLEGQLYLVRILYNPQGETYKATRNYNLTGKGRMDISITWDKKYGIITDRKAPQELIDHLVALADSSWMEWWFNFGLKNGTYVQYQEHGYNVISTWDLDTWFLYTEYLKLKQT